MTLTELLTFVPLGNSPPVSTPQGGVRVPRDGNPSFVEAPLRELTPIRPGETSVVLLSSPAAMGKTTLAQELAHRQQATLWQLAQISVGSATFTGTVQNLYGADASTVFDQVASGQHLFVLDALDETKTRSPHGFDDFILDVSLRMKAPRAAPTLVLLGRTETVEWVELLLDDDSVPYAHYAIDFFDRQGAIDFIALRLDARRAEDGRQSIHGLSPFRKVRDQVFDLVYRILGEAESGDPWETEAVQSFLGYAPVLEAFVDFLDDTNPTDLAAQVRSLVTAFEQGDASARDRWRFLVRIVDNLADRESRKLVDPLREAHATTPWDGWHKLYGADEQCARVLERTVGPAAGPLVPVHVVPDPIAGAYDSAVQAHNDEHVFVGTRAGFANVVFQEYLYAWALTHGDDRLREAVRAHIRSVRYLPSPLLARFMLHFSESESDRQLSGQDVGLLYDSIVSRLSPSLKTWLLVDGDDMEGVCVVSTRQSDGTSATLSETTIPVILLDGLRFWRRVQHAEVSVNPNVTKTQAARARAFAMRVKV